MTINLLDTAGMNLLLTKISGEDRETDSSGPGEFEPPCSVSPAEPFAETETVPKECVRCGYIARNEDSRDYHMALHRWHDQRQAEGAA